jgi:hypothetical protein
MIGTGYKRQRTGPILDALIDARTGLLVFDQSTSGQTDLTGGGRLRHW